MSDFDFDEIDKAVSSALSGAESSVSASSTVPTSPTPLAAPAPKPRTPAADHPHEAAQPARPRSLATRRSAGRFMDMVHPSSDMRGTPTKTGHLTARPARVERRTFVAPQSSSVEHHNVNDLSYSTPAEAGLTSESPWAPSLESPFLPDAKVEKKPLGTAHPTGEVAAPLFEEADELLLEAPDELLLEAHTMPDPLDFIAATSDDDISQGASLEQDAQEVTPRQEAEKAGAPHLEETQAVVGGGEEEDPTRLVGPTSIRQQYEERAPVASQESGAIYDTEEYHKPLVAQEKTRHGAWAVLWILALVVLGAAAGGVVYLYVLPVIG